MVLIDKITEIIPKISRKLLIIHRILVIPVREHNNRYKNLNRLPGRYPNRPLPVLPLLQPPLANKPMSNNFVSFRLQRY